VKYSDLVEDGANDTKKQEFLAGGGMAAITIRIPKNLRDAGKEAATLKGVSFSAFIRMCMIDELVKRGQ
jgi:predicted DNA binding CopG/RHH family protein